jgi:hypothetical protein
MRSKKNYGGMESQDDGDSSDDEAYRDDTTTHSVSNTQYVSEIDDSISKEDFVSGTEDIYDSWELGIADTDMNETEVEGDIMQDFQLLNSFDEVVETNEQDQSSCFGANGNRTTSLLGGCGCQNLHITQEISEKLFTH